MSTPAAYGHDLEPSLHYRLRTDPPPSALDWVRQQTGARRILSVTALEGGRSSAVHLIVVETGPGTQLAVVLRRYVLDWVLEEPEAPGNEALILAHLNGTPTVPAPRLIAADLDGTATGSPAVLMTPVPGRIRWRPSDPDAWLNELVRVMIEIHQVPLAPELAQWYPYGPTPDLVPPPWTQHRWAWERALEAYAGPRPESPPVFLHRDFHPGNVLWTDDRVTGVVDWVSSCAGPAEEDVAHCRADLALHAGRPDLADRFLLRWQQETGRSGAFDPYWDLVNLVSCTSAEPDPVMDEYLAGVGARC